MHNVKLIEIHSFLQMQISAENETSIRRQYLSAVQSFEPLFSFNHMVKEFKTPFVHE